MKLKFVITCYLTTFIFIHGVIRGQQATTAISEAKNSIDSFIEQKMKETGIVGLGASIILDKKVDCPGIR